MAQRVNTYGAKGALATAAFSLTLMGVGGFIMYLSASEALDCERPPGGRASCRLTRELFGIPLRTDLGFVQGADMEESHDTRRFGSTSPRHPYQPIAWVVYHTDAGWVDGTQSRHFEDTRTLVEGLTSFLSTPTQPTFGARIASNTEAYRYASWGFVAGASILGLWILGWLFPGMRPKRR